MISVFSTENKGANGRSRLSYVVIVKVDHRYGIPKICRTRWNRTTHSFEAMFDKMYTARRQLFTVLGGQLFSELWWKVDDEMCRRGVSSKSVVKRTVEMCLDGILIWPTELNDWRPEGVDVDVAVAMQQQTSSQVKWEKFPYAPVTPCLEVKHPACGYYNRKAK